MAKAKKEKKIFVLDTSVILYDHNAVKNFQEHDVAIPITVLEELDNFKKGNDTKNFEAREFIRFIDKISGEHSLQEWIPLEGVNRGKFKVQMHNRSQVDAEVIFDDRKADHRILNAALTLQEENPGSKVIMVNKDINLRLKAKALNLPAEDYETGKIKNVETLYTGKTTLSDVASEVITKLHETGKCETEEVIKKGKARKNHFYILKSERNSVLACYDPVDDCMTKVEKREVYGIRPRNAEQTFAIHAILDPDIKLITIQGVAGTGKTLLASRLPGLLPDLDPDAAVEVSSIRSLAGLPLGSSLVTRPPIEAPHHSATMAALIGGGSGLIRPGAISRAAHGVLFLDEAPEFAGAVLDALRQPLETGEITIHRARTVARFPARFQLVMAANPCPCGHGGDDDCTCTPIMRRRYLGRLSGPLLDRIDLHVTVRRVSVAQMTEGVPGVVSTAAARARVIEARARSRDRWGDQGWSLTAHVPGPALRSPRWRLAAADRGALDRALERGALTMRGYDRVLRVAWTLADLDGADRPSADHLGRALYLRKGI